MKERKWIRVFGERARVAQVGHWEWDEALDAPEASPLSARRFERFVALVKHYREANAEGVEALLDETFHYSSDWVAEKLVGIPRFMGYFRGKCHAWRNSQTPLDVIPVCIDAALFPQKYAYAAWLRQGQVETLLVLSFNEERLQSLSMKDPDLYDFHPIATPLDDAVVVSKHYLQAFLEGYARVVLLNGNGEPLVARHRAEEALRGTTMAPCDFLTFAVDFVKGLLCEAGYTVVSTLRTDGGEYPNLVATFNGARRYFYIKPYVAPQRGYATLPEECGRIEAFANGQNAEARLLPVGFYSLEKNNQNIHGGTFAIRPGHVGRF